MSKLVLYEDQINAISQLSDSDYGKLIKSVIEYRKRDDYIPPFTDSLLIIFNLIKNPKKKKKNKEEKREKEKEVYKKEKESKKEDKKKKIENIINSLKDNVIIDNVVTQLPVIQLPVIPVCTDVTEDELYFLSREFNLWFYDVKKIYKNLKEQVEAGLTKKPCKNFKATLRVWIRNDISWGNVEVLTEMEQEMNFQQHSPESRTWELSDFAKQCLKEKEEESKK